MRLNFNFVAVLIVVSILAVVFFAEPASGQHSSFRKMLRSMRFHMKKLDRLERELELAIDGKSKP